MVERERGHAQHTEVLAKPLAGATSADASSYGNHLGSPAMPRWLGGRGQAANRAHLFSSSTWSHGEAAC